MSPPLTLRCFSPGRLLSEELPLLWESKQVTLFALETRDKHGATEVAQLTNHCLKEAPGCRTL